MHTEMIGPTIKPITLRNQVGADAVADAGAYAHTHACTRAVRENLPRFACQLVGFLTCANLRNSIRIHLKHER